MVTIGKIDYNCVNSAESTQIPAVKFAAHKAVDDYRHTDVV